MSERLGFEGNALALTSFLPRLREGVSHMRQASPPALPDASRGPAKRNNVGRSPSFLFDWVPAFAGMSGLFTPYAIALPATGGGTPKSTRPSSRGRREAVARGAHLFAVLTIAVCVAACATAAKVTLEDRFQAIGIPQGTAECMVDDLDERLSDDDLQDLARYSVRLARAKSTADAIRSLMQIDNPRAVTAIGRSAVSCVTGFRP